MTEVGLTAGVRLRTHTGELAAISNFELAPPAR